MPLPDSLKPAVRYASTVCGTFAALLTLPALALAFVLSESDVKLAPLRFGPLGFAALLWLAAARLRRNRRDGAIAAWGALLGLAAVLLGIQFEPALRYPLLALDAATAVLVGAAWRHLRG